LEELTRRRLISRRDSLLLAALLCVAAGMLLVFSLLPRASTAVIEYDGNIVAEQELSALAGPKEVTVEGDGGIEVTVRLSPQGAQVIRSGCRDQVCVRTGLITRAGESVLCLPAKVSVRLTGGSGGDAQTY
jgi:hypothetical protein